MSNRNDWESFFNETEAKRVPQGQGHQSVSAGGSFPQARPAQGQQSMARPSQGGYAEGRSEYMPAGSQRVTLSDGRTVQNVQYTKHVSGSVPLQGLGPSGTSPGTSQAGGDSALAHRAAQYMQQPYITGQVPRDSLYGSVNPQVAPQRSLHTLPPTQAGSQAQLSSRSNEYAQMREHSIQSQIPRNVTAANMQNSYAPQVSSDSREIRDARSGRLISDQQIYLHEQRAQPIVIRDNYPAPGIPRDVHAPYYEPLSQIARQPLSYDPNEIPRHSSGAGLSL
jgi:hypothetical protein